jgi:IS5 family transposase
MNIKNYGLREKYEELSRYGDRLAEMEKLINWEAFRPMLTDLYRNNTELGGRPNNDPVLMVKILFLQSTYNLVDEAMEKEIHNRIDFMNFLGYPDHVPDSRTIWLFRERLSSTGKDKMIWSVIWKQFESLGISVKKGVVQDASFIESDPGKHGKKKPPVSPDMPEIVSDEKKDTAMTKDEKRQARRETRIRSAERKRIRRDERKSAGTRRSKDGTWAKKGNKTHFGNKIHTVQGTDIPLIREFVVTTASLHDSKVDLGIPGIPTYRDKGYSGSHTRGIDGTMEKASRNHPLEIDQIRRNKRITRKRSPGERPYSVIKGIFHGDHVFVTMVRRVRVKATFMCIGYNLMTMITLKKQGKVA